jgi:FkbM family methyltransferase
MFRVIPALCFLFLTFSEVNGDDSLYKFEGILGQPVKEINNMNVNGKAFIPYNPVVVEIGSHEGNGLSYFVDAYPYGKIYAFEPRPNAYRILKKKFQEKKNVTVLNCAVGAKSEKVKLYIPLDDMLNSSLLKSFEDFHNHAVLEVSCVNLREWCFENHIDHIDFLRLDTNGTEFQIIQSAPDIIDQVTVIVTKTYFHKPRKGMVPYHILKSFLEEKGFEMLSHWYKEGCEGEATFIRKEIYDAMFR